MFKLRASVLSPLFSGALLCAATLHMSPALADWINASSNRPTFLAAASGSTVYAADSTRVYGSTDGGKTWSTLGSPAGAPYTALAYLGSNLWVGTDKSGTSYSGNGSNWTVANSGQMLPLVNSINRINHLSAVSSSTLLAANTAGIYRSTDGGTSWSSNVTGLPQSGIAPFLVKGPVNVLASNGSASIAGTNDGIYRSTDTGATWSNAALSGSTVSNVLAVPGSSTFLAIAGGTAYRSTDNGASWSAISGLSGGTPTAFAAHPSDGKTLYVGTNAGTVLQSTDGGSTWAVISDATTANQTIQALAVPGSDPTSLVAATSNGTYLYAAVTTPAAFSFTSRTGVTPKETVVSDAITVTGLTQPTAISIQGGEYSINGGAYTSATGTVTNGAKVTVRVTASSTFGTTTSTTLTIGKNSGKFEVTTQSFTAITTPTELLSTVPTGVTVTNGILQVTGTTTLDLKPTAPPNALVQIPANTPVTVVVGGNSATVTPTASNANFTTRTVVGSNGQSFTGLALSGGSANIVSSQPLTVPISSGFGSLQFGGGASLQLTSSGGFTGGGVVSGSGFINTPIAGHQTSANRFAAGGTTIYGGENFTIDQNGYLKELRIGSLNGDKAVAGDPVSLANLDSDVKVPKLDGNLARLNNTASLIDVIKGALDTQFNGSGTASYDATSGIFTYVLGDKTYRFIPLGSPTIQLASTAQSNSNFSATNAASAASGAFSLSNRGVQITLSSALGYFTELDQAIKGYDKSGSFKLRSDGTLKMQLLGLTAVAAPGSAVTSGTATGTPTFGVDADNRFTFVDSKGSTQTFYPVFADQNVLTATLQGLDSKASVTYLGNGSTQAIAPNWQYTFKPEYFVSTADAAHANDLWWVNGSKVFIRYSDNTMQSFGF